MKPSRLAFAFGLTMLAAPALARLNPNPPPSGIVVHLFGPNSITSHVLPTFGVPAGAPTAAPGGANAGTQTAAPTGAQTGAAQTVPAQNTAANPEPTAGQILHQMFVVGDPSKTPAQILAPGRAAEHPLATNP